MNPYRRTPRSVDRLAFLRMLRFSRIVRFTGEATVVGLIGLGAAAYIGRAPHEQPSLPTPDSIADGSYVLLSHDGPVCLEAPSDPNRKGAMSAKGCWESGAQEWLLTRQREGEYTLQSRGTKSCLDMPWGKPGSNMRVIQFPCHGNTNQRWALDPTPNDKGTFAVRSVAEGECLTARHPGVPMSSDVTLAACDNSPGQEWLFTRVSAPSD